MSKMLLILRLILITTMILPGIQTTGNTIQAVYPVSTTEEQSSIQSILEISDNDNDKLLIRDNNDIKSHKNIKVYNKIDTKAKKLSKKSTEILLPETGEWKCPNISQSRNLECGCDMPHTLRCSGDIHSLKKIADALRVSMYSVSLLDCTLKNVTFLSDAKIFENISLHGLVISSGEIKRVHRSTFLGLKKPLQALGLPNNALLSVPWNALLPLSSLERLDLSNNRIKALGAADFVSLPNLTYLELSDNQISSISLRTFSPLKNLMSLKLSGNRLGDFPTSLQAIGQCINLKELNLKSNSIKGPLSRNTLPSFGLLEALNLDRNLLTSIQNGALQGFPYLVTLSLRHNQIDVLQDHAFSGLSSVQILDLGYNGIVAVSGASLQHLSRLIVLDLTHNFLRALTSDLIRPLPSLKELRLDGNDISIVAKNALDGANELHSLSLEENPLSCDCTLKPFAEWLSVSKIPSQDLLGAICATPPHLEGAPLLQIPIESLNCDGSNNNNDFDNTNVMKQLDVISHQNNLSLIKDFSDVITLKNLHLSTDYGIILTWIVNMKNEDFICDAIFVYKESNIHEILLDNSPIRCESYMIDNENIVSVILQDASNLIIGDSYRFCLVLIQTKNIQRDLIVGCSNITKLELIENIDIPKDNNYNTNQSDITMMDKISSQVDHQSNALPIRNSTNLVNINYMAANKSLKLNHKQINEMWKDVNGSFLPGLGAGILVTSLFVLFWGIAKLRNEQRPSMVSTCYMASSSQPNNRIVNDIEPENRNQYLKLQATTNL